jgi:predicted nuclease with TOPRIM domain
MFCPDLCTDFTNISDSYDSRRRKRSYIKELENERESWRMLQSQLEDQIRHLQEENMTLKARNEEVERENTWTSFRIARLAQKEGMDIK